MFRINHFGLRGPDFSPTKEPGTLRITFIGDSVTFGGGVVSDGDTFVSLSAARLSEITGRKVDSVNISAPGWGVSNMEQYIERRGVHCADIVVWILPREGFHRPMSWAEGMPYRKPAFRLISWPPSHYIRPERSGRKSPTICCQKVQKEARGFRIPFSRTSVLSNTPWS
jgi:hypothetical protein